MQVRERPSVGPVRLADALGWAGAALGAPMVLAPRRFLRAIGVRPSGEAVAWTVGVGLAVDLAAAIQLTRAEGMGVADGRHSSGEGAHHDTGGGPLRVRTAVTIRRGEDEVRRAFRDFAWSAFDPATLEAAGEARFTPAPGGRGTELHIDHEPDGTVLAKLMGRAPDQRINDELRRFKAQLETGVPVRSDKSPEGPSARRQILHKARPAQPAGSSG